MAAENESPAREPSTASTRGRGRGGRSGRGRGRGGGRGASNANANAGVTKSTATRGGRGGTRRGRAKNFSDSRVQAAYERQRDLKATYQAVAHALKPALQELAERHIDELIQNPDSLKKNPEHAPVMAELRANYNKRIAEHDKRLDCDLQLAEDSYNARQHLIEQEFKNGIEDLFEEFYEAQENRLRILESLFDKGLPVDVRDDQYEYKVISDEHYDKEFGIYEAYKDGVLVPYPSRVEGTEMYQKARDAEAASVVAAAAAAAAASTTTTAPTRGRGRGRGGIKRKPAGDPDGVPTPKRTTRNTEENQLLSVSMAPAPAKGLLASAAEADIQPEGTPAEEESPSGSPEPTSFFSSMQSKMPGKLIAREKSPPLPKNIGEPDEHGVRAYSQRGPKAQNARVMAPNVFEWDSYEIGFRDSSNDASKGHTRAKRGKYLDKPNNNSMHFDQWCNSFDYSSMDHKDFDQELVEKHGVHPKYGIFLPTSKNEKEEPRPYVMPGKPVVFIANPSGRISHASRSLQPVVNHLRMLDSPYRSKISASMRRFCKLADIDPEEISIKDYVPTDEELREKSLGTAVQELESRPVLSESSPEAESEAGDEVAESAEEVRPDLSALTDAASYLDTQEASRPAAPAPKKPMKYDAVRDLFLSESKPPPPPPPAAPNGEAVALAALADLCSSTSYKPLDWPPHNERVAPVGYPSMAQDQPPLSNERENSYAPTTPAMGYHDPRMSVDTPQHAYPTARHPVEHVEASPYGSIRQASHTQVEPAAYPGGPPEPAPSHQAPPHAYGPPPDYGGYMPPQSHGGYPPQDPREPSREAPVTQNRPYEYGYEHRRMSSYASESPAYARPHWHQQAPPGPPPPPSVPQAPSPHYSLPPPPSRTPFSHHANAEPLPPLRPPRGRTQSIQDEPLLDPAMRQPPQNNYNPFYTPSTSTRPYQNSYPPPEPQPSYQQQSRPGERMLPNPSQPGQGYITSPTQSYIQPTGSPTFSTIQIGGGPPMGQNSPETPQGQGMTPNSAFRHRSTPSGSGPPSASSAAAADSKYRKLQPAPVPAHRAWTNKPELKTIPYDHKDSSGGSAALPNSGPTQIRGWNVNQHRRRNRSDKQDKSEAMSEREDSR